MSNSRWEEAALNGDHEAFRKLVDEFRPLVYRTTARFASDPSDCDDLTQEVFIEIWNSKNRFRGDSALSTWIYRITVNKALNYIRRQKRGVFLSLLTAGQKGADPPTSADTTANRLLQSEGARLIQGALSKLPDNQRIAFVLTQAEGLSQRQTAEVMALSESAVESLIQRAKANLRKRLKHYYSI